jgi:hypothetical protein
LDAQVEEVGDDEHMFSSRGMGCDVCSKRSRVLLLECRMGCQFRVCAACHDYTKQCCGYPVRSGGKIVAASAARQSIDWRYDYSQAPFPYMPYLPDVQCGTSFLSSALSGVHVRSPCGYCGIAVFPRRSRHWVAGSGRASVCNEGDANVYNLLACLLDLGHSTGPMRRGDRAGRRPRAGCLSDKTRAHRPDWTLIVGCSGTSRHA